MSPRSIATNAAMRLAQFATAASRRPWAVLWIPLPVAWQMAARHISANRLEEALALLLTIPEVMGSLCLVGLLMWQLWSLAKIARQRIAHNTARVGVYPWFARIGLWFGVGFFLSAFIVP